MKYDITKPQTKGAKRVLDSVGSAFFNLLTEKDFADISINEVCERSGYPRATFYNYFDDKYDLLNYLWYSVTKEINLEEYADIAPKNRLPIFFDRLYNLFDKWSDHIQRIIEHNQTDDYFMSSIRIYLNSQIKTICESCVEPLHGIPSEMLAEHYANTLYLVMEWRFLKGNDTPKETLFGYLTTLLEL